MRLLTFNTLFKGDVRLRLHALAALLERSSYDVVCLQEIMYRGHVRLLRQAAPSFRHHAVAGPLLVKGGLVLLSRLPILGCRFVRYPISGPMRPELVMRKGAQIARIAAGGAELTVVNTHLSANHDDDWSPANRYARVETAELAHLARHLPDGRIVVVGDLNVPRDSAALAGFLAETDLRDVLAGDSRPTYRPTARWPAPPAFDHVLVRGGVTGQARPVLQDAVRLDDGRQAYLSDHFGVETELEW